MRCKARTVSGEQCRNSATTRTGLCHVHRNSKNFVSKDEYEKDISYSSPNILHCSFCGKSQHEVEKLIAGPSVFICDECTELCVDIMVDEDPHSEGRFVANLRKTLGIPLKSEIDIESLGIKPRFNKLKFTKKDNHCFYLCPFKEPFNSVYSDHVNPVLSSLGFTVERADEVFGTQPIVEDIWESINSSEFVLADVTGRNPNVMYEIGMAHTVGKPVVIITQNIDDVPFDLKHYRCIVYKFTPKGIKEFEQQLEGTMRFLKSNH